jgi:alkylhydroperoxidase family enzyme
MYLARDGLIGERARELVVMRMAWRTGSEYEFAQHAMFARAAGFSEDEIRAVTREADGVPWSDDDRILLRFVDELYELDDVTDETWEALRGHYGSAELVELLVLAGYYRMVAAFLRAMRVQLEDDVQGFPTER